VGTHNLLYKLGEALANPVVETGTTLTLTRDDLVNNGVIVGNNASGLAITLPDPAACKGLGVLVANKGAGAVTLVTNAVGVTGYGGISGAGSDVITIAQGLFGMAWSDGTYWYANLGGTLA